MDKRQVFDHSLIWEKLQWPWPFQRGAVSLFCDAISQILHPPSTDGWMNAEVRTLKLLLLKQVSNIMETMRYSEALKWPRIYSIFVHFAQYCVTLVIRLSCQKDYQCIRENEYGICAAQILHTLSKNIICGCAWRSLDIGKCTLKSVDWNSVAKYNAGL